MLKTVGYAALTFAMLFIGLSVGNDLLAAFKTKKP
jgi:hypothetical protein